jgi:hypothetical protein
MQSTAYNNTLIAEIDRPIEKEKFAHVLNQLVQRHESFRTSFKMIEGEAVQWIHDDLDFEIQYYHVKEESKNKTIQEFIRPFDLSKAPLLRVGIIQLSEDKHLLIIDKHHIITDGISFGIFIKDFLSYYAGKELPELKLQYKDYAGWQNRNIFSEEIKKQERYWLKKFAGPLPVLALPTDFPRPMVFNPEGAAITINIEAETQAKLTLLAAKEGVTIYMLLVACYNILFYKLTGQGDIIVGTDSSGRQHPDLQNVIGMFINTLAIRNYPDGKKTFSSFLKEVKNNILETFENQDYQFEKIVEQAAGDRDMSRNPLFDVALFFLNRDSFSQNDTNVLGLKSLSSRDEQVSLFDLVLFVNEQEKHLDFTLVYCTKLFTRKRVEIYTTLFKEIIQAIIDEREIKLKDIKCSLQLLSTQGEQEISLEDLQF